MTKKDQKVLTISVAAYNVESSLEATLDSLLIDELDLIEVLIINDGSKDNTARIAKKYEKKHPKTFRLINKKNGGYGSVINTSIKEAKGKYFKQLDGDDVFCTKNLRRLCADLSRTDSDVVYTPFVMNDVRTKEKTVEEASPRNYKAETIDDLGYDDGVFHMHSLAFKTELLLDNNILIDENCFYTDTEYIVLPWIYSNTIKLLDYPVYEYTIGNEGQSVSKTGMLKHHEDHVVMTNRLLRESKTKAFMACQGRSLLEEYISSIVVNDIVTFKLDIFPFSRKSYDDIDKRIKEIGQGYNVIFRRALAKSKTLRIVSKFGYLGYIFMKKSRSVREILKIRKNV